MKKEIVHVDSTQGIFRVTTQDERWYSKLEFDKESKLPTITFRPSVTWIAESYPKGISFYKWLANKGWDEAEALKQAAADKGSKVHKAVEMLILGQQLTWETKFPNHQKEPDAEGNYPMERLTVEEWICIMSFVEWCRIYKPEFVLSEQYIESAIFNFAGTLDFVCVIDGVLYLVDIKTGQYIWPYMEIQESAYKQGLKEGGRNVENLKLAILQLGYRGNREKQDGTRTMYKFTEVPDQFDLFLAARRIWQKEHGGESPKQKDYPMTLAVEHLQKIEEPELVAEVEGPPEKKKAVKKPKNNP